VGNHDWTDADDLGTTEGLLYNSFTDNYGPQFFGAYTNPYKRGRRWYGKRLRSGNAPTNTLLFVTQNVADTALNNYAPNAPQDGSGWEDDDYDGIRDSWSPQRKDLTAFVNNEYETGDVLFIVGHRAFHSMKAPATRPTLWPADSSSYMGQMDDDLGAYWFLLMGDTHENMALGLINRGTGSGGHYSAAACNQPRNHDPDSLAAYGDTVKFLSSLLATARDDTLICDGGGAALDSLGADGSLIPSHTSGWTNFEFLHRFEMNGTSVTHSVIVIRLDGEPYEGWSRTVEMTP